MRRSVSVLTANTPLARGGMEEPEAEARPGASAASARVASGRPCAPPVPNFMGPSMQVIGGGRFSPLQSPSRRHNHAIHHSEALGGMSAPCRKAGHRPRGD